MSIPAFGRRFAALGATFAVSTVLVSAQSPALEERARELYASAEYDQALSLIGDSQVPAAQQYRALCLLALGRQSDAEATLEHLISSAPDFAVSEKELPPRFVALFAQQRREVVPAVLRRLFAEAREDYRAKAYDRALPQFKKVLALSSGAEVRDVEGIADLRLLAESFIDIANASGAPKAGVAAAAAAPAAGIVEAPRRRITPPVAIKQNMPPWPGGGMSAQRALSGSVRIRIGSDGRVASAAMVKKIAPHYDTSVLHAARLWEYKPATDNGVPVEFESIVEINIKPTR